MSRLHSIEEIGTGKSNNLQCMKFIAACLVIVSHAYPLCKGKSVHDPLFHLTDGRLSFGGLAVSLFFLSGGFLIAKSVERKQNAKTFFLARCQRIFPPLWCIVIVSMIMGAFVTEYSMKSYLLSPETWKYMGNGFFILVHNLPGVFTEAVYQPTVNGALWTLPVEFMCYILCFICYKTGFFAKKRCIFLIIPAVIVTAFLLVIEKQFPMLMQIVRPCILFFIGMCFWIYRKNIKVGSIMILPTAVLLLISFALQIPNIGIFFLFPMLCFSLWFTIKQVNQKVAYMGNISYGIYLSGFPIQQLLVHLNHNDMSIYVNMLLAIPIAVVIGFLLYICIESKVG